METCNHLLFGKNRDFRCSKLKWHDGPHVNEESGVEWETDNRTQSELAAAAVAKQAQPGAWLASLTSAERKECAVSRGFFAYFPDAIAIIARHSVRMNEKHNPGKPVHWAREKSTDQPDCEARHLIATSIDPDFKDADSAYEIVCKAWRALADLQLWIEAKHAKGEKI